MPTHLGPNPSADNSIVFSYDVGDTSNSYIGEPTVNIHADSEDVSKWTGNLFGNWIDSGVIVNSIIAPNGSLTADIMGEGFGRFNASSTATPGQSYTYSVYLKNISLTSGFYIWYAFGLNGGLVTYGQALFIPITSLSTSEWTRFSVTVTAPGSGINQVQFGPCPFTGYNLGTSYSIPTYNITGTQLGVWGGQIEQKSHVTPYTPGTRSSTQGLLPLISNTSLNISTVSFNSNAQLVFDGTDDYINLPTNLQSGYTQATYEFICRPTSLPGAWNYFQLYIQETSTWMALYNVGSGAFFGIDLNNGSGWFDGNGGSTTGAKTTATLTANTYYHIVYSWDGTVVRIYLNGVLQSTTSTLQASNGRQNVTTLGAGDTPRNIGARGGGNYWPGTIDVVKFYNTAISTDQVKQNYNQYKSRFNLS
jgi:hypothetical protein